MPCIAKQLDDGVLFMCGAEPEVAPCAYCGLPSTCLCDWPVTKRLTVEARSLKRGDLIFPFEGHDTEPYRVEYVGIGQRGGVAVVWEYKGRLQTPYEYDSHSIVFIAGKGTCDEPCCDNCHRSVDEDRDYCRAHWRQEEIA